LNKFGILIKNNAFAQKQRKIRQKAEKKKENRGDNKTKRKN
jgi:hypothetical protein